MRREAEIVVRRQIDDRAVVKRRLWLLLVFEDAELPVQALLFERVQFGREVRERIAPHDVGSAVRKELSREVGHQTVDLLQLVGRREKHDAEEAAVFWHAEAGAVNAEDASRA